MPQTLGGTRTNRAPAAEAQPLVVTRLLVGVHHRGTLLGRLQRIYPRARLNCNPPAEPTRASAEGPSPAYWGSGPEGLSVSDYDRAGEGSPRPGTDSDLEAFSHYPADGSFAALPGRTAAEANYPNPRFLSY